MASEKSHRGRKGKETVLANDGADHLKGTDVEPGVSEVKRWSDASAPGGLQGGNRGTHDISIKRLLEAGKILIRARCRGGEGCQ